MKTRCNLTVVLLGAMFAFLFAASARAGAGDAYASAVHVATDGDDSAAGTAAEPMQTIAAAVAKAAQTPGTAVVVHPGTHSLASKLTLSGGMTLVADEGPQKTTLTCASGGMDLLEVKDADTVLSGFSITMPSLGGSKKCLTVGTGAVVTNCVVRDLKTNAEAVSEPVLVSGGTMVDCVITNFIMENKWNSKMGVKISSGLVDRCVIVDNVAKYKDSGSEGAVRISGGTLRNSLVARNRSTGNGTGVTLSGSGCVENCTIVGNSCYSGADATATGLYQTGGTVVNTIIYDNTSLKGDPANVTKSGGTLTCSCMTPLKTGTGNIDGVPAFADAASGDYRLGYCAATDAGTTLSWHEGATDLSLVRARVLGTAVDMGCYESEPPTLGCYFTLNALSGFAPLAMTATATVAGDTAGLVYKWYVNGGATPDFSGADCASVSWNYTAGTKSVRLVVENGAGLAATNEISGISVSPKVAYVDCTNTSGSAYPYDGDGNACTNIEEVLAKCLTGVEVRVKPGTYTLNNTVYLTGGTKLVATGGPLVTTLTCPDKTMGLLDTKDAGTVLSGFSLTMPSVYGYQKCLSVGTGAVVTNCIVRDLKTNSEVVEEAVVVSGGTMVDCMVTNFVCQNK